MPHSMAHKSQETVYEQYQCSDTAYNPHTSSWWCDDTHWDVIGTTCNSKETKESCDHILKYFPNLAAHWETSEGGNFALQVDICL